MYMTHRVAIVKTVVRTSFTSSKRDDLLNGMYYNIFHKGLIVPDVINNVLFNL